VYIQWCDNNGSARLKKKLFVAEMLDKFGLKQGKYGAREEPKIRGFKLVKARILEAFRALMNNPEFMFVVDEEY
jgi:hypothetical protein